MDLIVIPLVLILISSISLVALSRSRQKDAERLKKEIDQDFIEEFCLNEKSSSDAKLDLVVKWLEDEQKKRFLLNLFLKSRFCSIGRY